MKRQKKQHKEVEDTEAHDKSFYWGKSRFTFKAHNQIPGAGYDQADCPLNECKHKEFDEDGKRSAEKDKDFGEKFINLARNVYKFNDERAKIKLSINNILGSNIKEVKSYE